MQTIERTVTVDKPIYAVWEYLADFRSTNDWDPGTVHTEMTSGDGTMGTVYKNTSRFLGKEVVIDYTVVDYEPRRLLRLRGVGGAVVTTDTLTFEGSTSSSIVRYEATFKFKGVARAADALMALPLQKLGDKAETGLREALEAL